MGGDDAVPMETNDDGPVVAQTHALPLLQLIKVEQARNGVVHSDFRLYRKHCGNKLRCLFKLLKFQHGRTKYQKRRIEATTAATDVRFLHIIVFYAERAWGYAMQLKKENEGDLSLMRRSHLIRRLRKASSWADELVRLASQCCDSRSQIEAHAYAAWMNGSLLLEQEKDWALALAKFTRAKMLYEGLSAVQPPDQQTLGLQMVEDIKTSIRYCAYQMERKGTAAPSEQQLLVKSDPDGQSGLTHIKAQLDDLGRNSQAYQVVATMHLAWYGKSYPVKSDRVRSCLHQANEYAAQLSSTASQQPALPSSTAPSSSSGASEPLLALYTRMINSYNEAKSHVRAALKSTTAAEGDAQYEELVSLEMAIQGTVQERVVERSSLMVQDAEERFAAGMERVALGKRAREKDKYSKAEDVVVLLDGLARGLGDLAELGVRLGGRQGEALHELSSARSAGVQARRCYYVAQALLASDKPLEAYALFGRAAERLQAAKQRLGELPATSKAAVQSELSELQQLAGLIAAYRGVAHAEHMTRSLKDQESLQQGVSGMSLDAQEQALAQAQGPSYLLDQLEVWESFAGQQGSKAPRIFRIPYAMQPIPMRPIMLDTASSFVEYPSLDHRFTKQEKKSTLLSMFGWGSKK